MRATIPMCALALAVAFAAPAWADEPQKVSVLADVVLVSNQGNSVDPGLAEMKELFTKKHLNFSSYKRVSSETVSLEPGKSRELKLPGNQSATLKLIKLQRDEATVEVHVGAVKTVYTLGREGSVFVNAGRLKDGEVFLVLAPATSGK